MAETESTSHRRTIEGLAEAGSTLSLGLWAGVLLMVGVTAAVSFPLMADLDVRIPGYESFDGEHHRIAAGQVLNRAFLISDWIGLLCLAVAIVCIGVLWGMSKPDFRRARPGLVLRLASLGVLAIITIFQTAAFRPSLNSKFEQLWGAAQRGENERAAEIRDRLAPQHAKASFLLATQFTLVLVAGLSGGFDGATRRRREAEDDSA